MVGRPYTKGGRLSDVLALIQVLALDEHTHRSAEGLDQELQQGPSSSGSWFTIGREHPEFFRVVTSPASKEPHISLVARHVLPHEEGKHRPTLSPDFTASLLNTAITLHDHQVQEKEWWKSLIPLISAFIGAAAATATTLLTLWLDGWCRP